MNLNSFITRGELAIGSKRADANPDLHPDEIPDDADHYLCSLRGRTHEMEFHYTSTPGEGPPSLPDALRYLGAVAAEFESCDDILEWADEYGFDPGHMDTRSAFDAVCRLSRDLWRLVGDAMYDELRQGVEIEQAVNMAWASFDRSRS